MKIVKYVATVSLGLVIAFSTGACEEASDEDTYVEDNITNADVVAGGLMYDKWWAVTGATAPTADHPLWDTQSSNTRTGSDSWRCKECHGWDYQGKDGAYSSGSHYTGFPGIYSAMSNNVQDVFDQLESGTDHDFGSVMADEEILDLAKFITEGLIDMGQYIDGVSKAANGDSAAGKALYENTSSSGGQCIACHGALGTGINFGSTDDPEYLGTLANGNPWETLHKIRYGHPGSSMPSTVANGLTTQDAVDILTYSQTLPANAAEAYVAENYAGADVVDGGLTYDKWWVVTDATAPTADHPLWDTQSSNTRTGSDTWRCKECHGWDYQGADGAYGSGSHYTGFAGVFAAADQYTAAEVFQLIGETEDHDFSTAMADNHLLNLTKFIKEELIDMSDYIDYSTKTALGDTTAGQSLYEDTSTSGGRCITCHGADGTQINFGDETDPEYLGDLADGNPWETLHKIRFGHPGSLMPSTVENGLSTGDAADILTYCQSL
jgi:mono/diheme cytochrome c family protein/ribosomal protein L37AE/L43A